jgi:hypothetical protein
MSRGAGLRRYVWLIVLDVVVIIAGDGYYRGMERHHYFDASDASSTTSA